MKRETSGERQFRAENETCIFSADDPLVLLGLVKIYEVRGADWQPSDEEVQRLLRIDSASSLMIPFVRELTASYGSFLKNLEFTESHLPGSGGNICKGEAKVGNYHFTGGRKTHLVIDRFIEREYPWQSTGTVRHPLGRPASVQRHFCRSDRQQDRHPPVHAGGDEGISDRRADPDVSEPRNTRSYRTDGLNRLHGALAAQGALATQRTERVSALTQRMLHFIVHNSNTSITCMTAHAGR